MASTHHWELSMSLKVSNIVSQIHCKDFDNKKIFIFHLGGSEYFFSDSDTPTEGSSDNESYNLDLHFALCPPFYSVPNDLGLPKISQTS